MNPEPLLDTDQAAERLNVTPRFIRRLIAQRRIDYLKIGKFVRFHPAELDSWIEHQRITCQTETSNFGGGSAGVLVGLFLGCVVPGLFGSTRNCDRSGFVRLLESDRRPGEQRNAREYLLGTRRPAPLCWTSVL